MKRISAVLALTAALSFGVSAYAQTNPTGQVDNPQGQIAPQKPAELTDVPAGHWAQAAVKLAADCGLIRGFPDGTFRGNQPITRYQAALLVVRLIAVIKDGSCGIGTPGTSGSQISAEDFEALQNAVQELSADLAQLGVRVAELEDNAVTQDDLARVEELAAQARDLAEAAAAGATPGEAPDLSEYATLDDLARVEEIANEARDLAEAAAAAGGGDPEALKDLIDQVEAASIAADTALAQARELQDKVDELSGRVDDLESRLGELGATVEGQADSIAALNDLVVLLNQDVLSLQDRVAQLERGQGDLGGALDELAANAASQEDLEALREFTTLLRRDQTALQDRVADLEGRVTKVEADVKALDARVTTLENNAFTISGTISLGYRVTRTWFIDGSGSAPDFDIDRLGLTTRFSSGNAFGSDDATTDYADFGGSLYPVSNNGSVDVVAGAPGSIAPSGNREGRVLPGVTLNFALKPRNLLTNPNNFPAGQITLSLVLDNNGDIAFYGLNNNSNSVISPIALKLTGLKAQFAVGAAPVVINYGSGPGFKFTNYAFNNGSGRGDGFVADVSGAGLLPFNPTLTLVYGSKFGESFGAAVPVVGFSQVVGATGLNQLIIPALASRSLVTITFSDGAVAQVVAGAGSTTFNLIGAGAGAFVTSVTAAPSVNRGFAGNNGDNLYFRGARGTLSIIPGLTGGVYYADQGPSINASGTTNVAYGAFFGGNLFGLINLEGEHNISSVNGAPAQNASYIKAGVKLGIFSIGGNFRFIENGWSPIGSDSAYPYKTNQSGFGVDLGLDLGFASLAAYYDQRSRLAGTSLPDGPKAGTLNGASSAATNFGVSLTLKLLGFAITPSFDARAEDLAYRSVAGVTAVHDGSAAGALIRGLNLALGYKVQTDQPGNNVDTTINAYADLSIGAAPGFTLAPKAYFIGVTRNNGRDSTTNFGVNGTLGLPFLFGSRLTAGGAFDTTSHTAPAFTASTIWLTAGLAFNPSILPNSTLSVAFALRNDTNRNGRAFGPSFANPTGTWGNDVNGVGQSLVGLYTQFSYFDLIFAYGIFQTTPTGGVTRAGSYFSISYSVKF
jgi:predicted  nucleic acid-binding Zn-ribbon protein